MKRDLALSMLRLVIETSTSLLRLVVGKVKPHLPKQSTVFELVGFAVVATGFFSGLALFTYDHSDSLNAAATGEPYHNLGGPAGAWLAESLLSMFGLVSLPIAVILCFWGALMALGFVRWPKTNRFVGVALIVAVFCGLIHIENPSPKATHLSNGLGGLIGATLGNSLLNSVGYGGAVIGLIFAAVGGLVATGNLTTSNTAQFVEYLGVLLRRLLSDPTGAKGRRPTLTTPQTHGETSKRAAHSKTVAQDEDSESSIAVDFTSEVSTHGKPDVDIFQTGKAHVSDDTDLSALVKQLETQLHDFKIEGKITNVTVGPVVTTLEYEPTAGTKAAKIASIANDIARMLRAQSVRVITAVPGKTTVAIEIPSEHRRVIRLGDVLKSAKYRSPDIVLPVALGVDTLGEPAVEDLVQMPHLLIAGTTGSGKSVFINNLIAGLVCKNTAKEMRFVFIDPKMVELAAYKKLPHLACPVVSDIKTDAKTLLNRMVDEMEKRYASMLAVETRNIQEFNETIRTSSQSEFEKFTGAWQPLPYVVFLIDEFADMVLTLGKEAEELITRLAQKARAAGIHLVIATQRPSVDVVTGLIKANFPTRVAFRVQSGADSRVILDQSGAETLLGKGDLLYQSAGSIQR
ncbi:MAG: DNA translocase FtsK 4TM domain-containing protein, partial [Nitrospiraceae bacterium]